MEIQGSRWLITGGSAGIGEAIAQLAHQRGARVVINGRNADRLQQTAERLDVEHVVGDVGTDAEAIVSNTLTKLGGLEVLINNAGWGHRMTLEELDAERFEAMWRTNVLGAALVAKHCVPALRDAGGGAIVNVASTAGKRGYATGTSYVATKFALSGMTQCWQAELRPHDIRVIQVNPSEVQTGFGGKDPQRPMVANKLFSEDIAHAVVTTLEMDNRGFVPELTVFATNPWKES